MTVRTSRPRRVAHGAFFEPMFAAVRRAPPGLAPGLSRSLERFLCSRAVESRTDDDKSLVLATRLAPGARGALPASAPGESGHEVAGEVHA